MAPSSQPSSSSRADTSTTTQSSAQKRSPPAPQEPPSAKRRKSTKEARGSAAQHSADIQGSPVESQPNVDMEVIDLVGQTEFVEEEPNTEHWIRIGNFQCAICMDHCCGLVATHCGHLFCTTCLDSALKADAIRNNCPICRATIESKQRSLYTNRTKGYWPLELKILVAPRKAESTSSDAAISL